MQYQHLLSFSHVKMRIQYVIQVPADKEAIPPTGSFDIVETTDASGTAFVTLADIKEWFPFEGSFHFRGKVKSDDEQTRYTWQDLLAPTDRVAEFSDGIAHIHCLPMFEIAAGEDTDTFTMSPDDYEQWRSSRIAGREPFDISKYPPTGNTNANDNTAEASEAATDRRRSSSWFGSSASPDKAGAGEQAGQGGSSWWNTFSSSPDTAKQTAESTAVESHTTDQHSDFIDPFGTEESAARNRRSSAQAPGGGGLFKGIMSAASKAATAAVHAASAAADTVEKKGWFSNISTKVNKAIANITSAAPSPAAMDTVKHFRAIFQTPFNATDKDHEKLLQRLWAAAFPGKPYERVSATWRQLGFKSDDPTGDLKPAGALLGLHTIVNFAEKHVGVFEALVESNHPTHASAREILLVSLPDDELAKNKQAYWELFAGPTGQRAVYDLCIATCWAFDHVWHTTDANLEEFTRVLEEALSRAKRWLSHGPTSLEQLHRMLDEEGIRL